MIILQQHFVTYLMLSIMLPCKTYSFNGNDDNEKN